MSARRLLCVCCAYYITAVRVFLCSAPIGICRCASSPIGPEIRPQNRRFAPTCALTSSFWHQLSPHPAVGRISLAQCTGTLPMLWDNTPGSLGCPPVPTQDGALSRWSPALSKRSVLMRRGTLKGPIPIKMSLCLLQLSVLSSGALHTPQKPTPAIHSKYHSRYVVVPAHLPLAYTEFTGHLRTSWTRNRTPRPRFSGHSPCGADRNKKQQHGLI